MEISIKYKLLLGKNILSCKTKLLVSTDGGKTFSFTPTPGYVSGDIGQLCTSGIKTIKYDLDFDKPRLVDQPLVFKVKVMSKDVDRYDILAASQVAVYPQMSYGVMLGMVKKYGWYFKARNDFNIVEPQWLNSFSYWERGTRLSITAGAMFKVTSWCYPYVGYGYGFRELYCCNECTWVHKHIHKWEKDLSESFEGLSIDAGFIIKIGKVVFTVGVSNLDFEWSDFEFGVGMML